MSLKLIHFPQTRSLRILWLIEELKLDVDVETRPFDRASLKTDDYLKLNPLGKTPVFFDGEKRFVESIAIIQYLSEKYADGKLSRRQSASDFGEFLQWLHFGEAGMGPYVGMLAAHTVLLPEEKRIPEIEQWAEGETLNCLNFLESELPDDGYLLNEFSLADISVGYILFLLKITGNGRLFGPKTNNYFNKIRSRDGWIVASGIEPNM